jgi:hypothetical protein
MHLAAELGCQFAQVSEVQHVVAIPPEAVRTVVAALNNVQRDAGENGAGLPGHEP